VWANPVSKQSAASGGLSLSTGLLCLPLLRTPPGDGVRRPPRWSVYFRAANVDRLTSGPISNLSS
jgi:hypothetical protein